MLIYVHMYRYLYIYMSIYTYLGAYTAFQNMHELEYNYETNNPLMMKPFYSFKLESLSFFV